VCGPDTTTVLGQLVQNLTPKTWVKMPGNTSLTGLTLDYSLAYYADSGVWDPVRHVVRWVGGPGACCANPAIYRMLTYDPAQDEWSVADTPFTGTGHAYDGNAVHSTTGDHYFTRYYDKVVRRWDGANWHDLPALPFGVGAAQGLAWFPSLQAGAGGLVFANGSGQLAWFDGTQWAAVPGAQADPWGTYHVFAEHNPVLNAVWIGGGNTAERVHYRLDSTLTLTRLDDAPFDLRVSDSFHSVDPVSGKFIVTKRADDSFWEFDMDQDQWTQITDTSGPKPQLSASAFHVSIPECGVILYFIHNSDTREVFLYRHE
jgi:hypothetical protein